VSDRLAKQVAERLNEFRDMDSRGFADNMSRLVRALPALAELVEAGAENAISVGVEYGANAPIKWDEALREVAAALGGMTE